MGEPTDSPKLPQAGDVVAGRFELSRRLAAGTMGAVYEGIDRRDGAAVAVKVLRPEFGADRDVRRRFRRESSILAAITHPGVVRTVDVGTDEDGRCYTAMELLRGETLKARMERPPSFEPESLLPIVAGICDALTAVHDHDIVHGDLKAANVFLVESGDHVAVKLVDFGLSKVLGLDRLTRTGEVIGTPAYMAPELLTGDGELDGRVDTYALGVLLYEALAGRLPFAQRNPGKLLFDIVAGKGTPLVDAAPGLSAPVAAVVTRAMQSERGGRYQTPAALVEAYRAAVEA